MKFGPAGRLAAISLAGALVLSACGDDGDDKSSKGKGLEKSELNIGVVQVPDAAPLYIAEERGFFKEEGLKIKKETVITTPLAIPKLKSGAMDIVLANYVSVFTTQDIGAITYRIISENTSAAPDSFAVQVKKDSPIKSPQDLKGKKIAVAAERSISDVLMTIMLDGHGVKSSDIKRLAPVDLPKMAQLLQKGAVDAVSVPEPFVTNHATQMGARSIGNIIDGPTKDFPTSGWAASDSWVKKYPKTMAAFQRAMTKALEVSKREEVVKMIPKYTKIDAKTASAIAVPVFPTKLSERRLARVVELLYKYKFIKKKPDLKAMIVAPTE